MPEMNPANCRNQDLLSDGRFRKDLTYYLLSHTGEDSRQTAQKMEDEGYDVFCIEGGYRRYLAQRLHSGAQDEETLRKRTQEIERSIIKKYRKQLWCQLTRAVRDYQLISEGDRIAVCISGGKDSMLMAKLMQEICRHGKMRFEMVFLCMNPGYNAENWAIIENNAKILDIPLTVCKSEIFDVVAGIDKNPCYLCARMRRGFLYANAQKLGCNKIALGHHYDDVIETILMGILYAGKTETMLPKLHSQHFPGMELIRPLYLVREESIKAWCAYNDLHFIQCACRFTEQSTLGEHGERGKSKRAEVKQLIASLREKDPVIEQNIFNCVRDINLRTVLGYHKDGKSFHFLDDYDTY